MTRISYAASLALSAAVLASLTLPVEAATYSTLYNFQHLCCGNPDGRLLLRSGSLFGTGQGGVGGYHGQVFKLTPSGGSWKEKTLFRFDGTDGSNPYAGLIQDSTGALYGTTGVGGAYGNGTVFKLAKSGGVWTETVLWSFGSGSDGQEPSCDLVRDSSTGTLYGTTYSGGVYGLGTVFDLTYSGGVWTENVLHSFGSIGGDGINPEAGLHRDTAGALYGTTEEGGTHGVGTVFELALSDGVWTETVLWNFGSIGGDGQGPEGELVEGSKGVFYGTTLDGGVYGLGTVFKLAKSGGVWTDTVLWNFEGGGSRDGAYPFAGLHLDSTGNLYGTTYSGGDYGYGTVFELTYSGGWIETVFHSFGGSGDGQSPGLGTVIEDSAGNVYGTAYVGGTYGYGTVWEVTP